MNDALVSDILDRYLYYGDVQRLAKDRGIPVSWSKARLIEALLTSGRFDPADAIAFLNLRDLRRLCREWRLPIEGGRDDLAETVLKAIWGESEPTPPKMKSRPEARAVGAGTFQSKIEMLRVTERAPESPRTSEPPSSRVHPDPVGPWAVVGIVSTVGVAAFLYWAIGRFGFLWGGVLSVAVATVLAVVLLSTSHLWIRTVARLVKRG